MGKLVEVKPPSAPTYIVELTQDEFDVIGGLVLDVGDRNRGVVVDYINDGDRVIPTERGFAALEGLTGVFTNHQSDNYEYYDFWQNYRD